MESELSCEALAQTSAKVCPIESPLACAELNQFCIINGNKRPGTVATICDPAPGHEEHTRRREKTCKQSQPYLTRVGPERTGVGVIRAKLKTDVVELTTVKLGSERTPIVPNIKDRYYADKNCRPRPSRPGFSWTKMALEVRQAGYDVRTDDGYTIRTVVQRGYRGPPGRLILGAAPCSPAILQLF